MTAHRILAIGIIAAALAASAAAHAASGVVKGTLQLWERNGGFCPATGRNCQGSNFLASNSNSYQPLANAKVYVFMGSAGAQVQIGQGVTSSSGVFQISWSTASTPTTGFIVFKGEHKDNVFSARNNTDALYRWQGTGFALLNGTTTTSPQNLAATRFGSSTLPDPVLNFWAAAETTWWYGMMGSNALFTRFTGVKLRGVYDGDCGTCAQLGAKAVRLNAAFDYNLPTVAHEMGHVASYVLNPRHTTGDYCYGTGQECTPGDVFCCNGSGGIGSHTQTSPEWQQVGFEEGFASAIATIALNQQSAPDPYFCTQIEAAPCATGLNQQMEPSQGLGADCTTVERRQENNATRYIWDIYDFQPTSAPRESFDNNSVQYWNIYEVITRFPTGYNIREKDEPLDPNTHTTFDNRDGFNGQRFQQRAVGQAGFPSSTDVMRLYDQNCGVDFFGFDP